MRAGNAAAECQRPDDGKAGEDLEQGEDDDEKDHGNGEFRHALTVKIDRPADQVTRLNLALNLQRQERKGVGDAAAAQPSTVRKRARSPLACC
jgi:hypothetical protein